MATQLKLVEKEKDVDRQKALDAALAQIDRAFGKGSAMKLGSKEAMQVESISTGSLGLDIALGIGGLPKGRVIEVYGPESSGKTTLALHVIAEAQKAGGTAAFVDAEHALDPVYAKKLGVDIDELIVSQPDTGEQALEIVDNLRLFSVEDALILVPEAFFQNHPTEARTVLAMMPDASRLLGKLLDGGHTRAAGRLAGALRSIGSEKVADEILAAMKAASHDVREINPFEQSILVPNAGRITSPHVHRIRLKWESMRNDVIDLFPKAQPITNNIEAYLKQIDEIYVTDAYHSLSIEGYRVSPELIDKVRSGTWNPETDEQDRALKDALAARGYWEAFQRVKESIRAVLEGADAGEVVERDLSDWYRNLFAPSVTAGILKASQLAGYRSSPVYIRHSQHVPMGPEAVRDCMPVFFDLLKAEDDPTVRIVLGHFIFVFIHPFLDGNGRIARFLMNVMMAAAGQPWTVIKLEQRAAYMAALETASVKEDIRPFAAFLAETRAAQ